MDSRGPRNGTRQHQSAVVFLKKIAVALHSPFVVNCVIDKQSQDKDPQGRERMKSSTTMRSQDFDSFF